jgi:hypothetical protein
MFIFDSSGFHYFLKIYRIPPARQEKKISIKGKWGLGLPVLYEIQDSVMQMVNGSSSILSIT